MKFEKLNWMDIEEYLKKDDRCIIPIGSTEQHAYLSLCTDSIFAERISADAASILKIPVLPVLNYGHTPLFMSYPGTITVSLETLEQVISEIIDSLIHHGFRRIVIVNGHGGNMPVESRLNLRFKSNGNCKIKFHNWWRANLTWRAVMETDKNASHASWMENFEWTRLNDKRQPLIQKEMADFEKLKNCSPEEARILLGDGSYGGYYQRSDEEMNKIWKTAVEELTELITTCWD